MIHDKSGRQNLLRPRGGFFHGLLGILRSRMAKNYFRDFGGGVFASGRKTAESAALQYERAIGLRVEFSPDLAPLFDIAGLKSVYAIAKALDEVGNKTKTIVTRTVAKQAGVKYGRAKSILRARQAMGVGMGSYEIVARDVTMSLKEFEPRRTAKGVSARPWGKRRVFPHTFMGPNGHVFVRRGKSRLPIHKLFGPAIPKEMVKDETERVFYATVAARLGPAVEKWLLRQIK